jgi:hypothetical protein
MRYLKQSTSTDVVVGPVVSTADYSRKTNLASDAAGIDCNGYKNGANAAIALAAAAGDGYWRHDANGYYLLTLATGAVDTAGRLRVTLDATGFTAPPVDYMVLPAVIYDAMMDQALLQVNVVQWLSGDVGGSAGVLPASTLAPDSVDASALKTDAVTEIVHGLLDHDQSDQAHNLAGTFGASAAQTALDTAAAVTHAHNVDLYIGAMVEFSNQPPTTRFKASALTASGIADLDADVVELRAVADATAADALAAHTKVDALDTDVVALKAVADAAAADALAAHTKVDALHDFDPAADDVAHVILVDRTIANDDHLEWLYTP